MNKCFKSLWNEARHAYVATSEVKMTHGKRSKSSVAVAAALALAAGLASAGAGAAYVETGVIGDAASWETAEYKANWGLSAMHASEAYALGYHGQSVKVGMMDSGFLTSHQELSGDRWHTVTASGEYTHDGERYPQYAYGSNPKDTVKYKKGDKFEVNGAYNSEYNDNHGTGCAGVYAGNRDGVGMHGVAWGSDFYSANTGGTDDSNYGPFPDYGFFKAGYDALVNAGVKIINNSFGTNLKQVNERGEIVDYYHSGPELTTVNDIEYEYYLFKKQYNEGPSFVDAAWDAVKGKDVIQVFTNGNNDRASPYHRALYPYFNPEAESQWIAIAGLQQVNKNTDPDNYKLQDRFNEAGYAKYWTLAGPSMNGATSHIDDANSHGDKYGSYSGTSMAAPFVSGAFAVLASRYQDMSAAQVREVLLTTANHKNADGTDMEGWANVDGTTPAEGEVSDRMGWGTPDLQKGMYGLGQLSGKFEYDLKGGNLDVWSNDISQVALDQRAREDIAWLKSVTEDGTVDGKVVVSDDPADYKLTNTSTGAANRDGQEHNYDLAGIEDKNISLEDAKKWRLEYYEKRAAAIREKIKNGLYDGSLVKRGDGTLVMTGSNSYRGGTTVEAGSLYGFTESFGSAPVVVKGGQFGLIGTYNDTFTGKGELASSAATARAAVDKAQVVVEEGGTYVVSAGEDVQAKSLEFKAGSKLTVGSLSGDVVEKALAGETLTGSVTADDEIKGGDLFTVTPDYAFFDIDAKAEGSRLSATMKKSADKTLATYAANSNAASVANALEASDGDLKRALLLGTKDEVKGTLASLGNDLHLSANQASVVNGVTLARAVKDEAMGEGAAKTAAVDGGKARLWVTGIGTWTTLDRAGSDMDSDFYAGLAGLEANITPDHKAGVFVGGGKTKFKAGADGKIDSDDLHVGLYGASRFEPVKASYGFIYSHQDRDSSRPVVLSTSKFGASGSYNASVMQLWGELAWTGLSFNSISVEPYAGLSWMRVKADSVTEQAGTTALKTDFDTQNLGILSLGARASTDFTLGTVGMKAKADLGWNQFMGDRRAKATLAIGDEASAKLASDKITGLATVGLGVEAQVAKNASLGVSYTGAFGSDVKSNGIFAKLKVAF